MLKNLESRKSWTNGSKSNNHPQRKDLNLPNLIHKSCNLISGRNESSVRTLARVSASGMTPACKAVNFAAFQPVADYCDSLRHELKVLDPACARYVTSIRYVRRMICVETRLGRKVACGGVVVLGWKRAGREARRCVVIDVECEGKDRSNETADRANQGRASRSEHGDELPAGLGVWCARPAKWGFNVNHRP